MNFDTTWGAPFASKPQPRVSGLSLAHMEKHIVEWTQLSQNRGYHTGLSTQVHMLLLQEPLDKMLQVLDSMRERKLVNLYYCGPKRALWAVRGVSVMVGCMTSFGSLHAFTWTEARAEAIRQATEWPGMASNGYDPPTEQHMRATLDQLAIIRRATEQMTDSTCVYCAETNG